MSMQPANRLDKKMNRKRYSFAVAVTELTEKVKRIFHTAEVIRYIRQLMPFSLLIIDIPPHYVKAHIYDARWAQTVGIAGVKNMLG
jgi:hypothetical protein